MTLAIDARQSTQLSEQAAATHEILDRQQTACCVVGGGPAGAILSLLLARRGVAVTLLEAHGDFDRDFRGDTLHPAILEILDEIGLADKLLSLPHAKMRTATMPAATGPGPVIDFGHLKTRFPFVALMPQTQFLEFLTGEAGRFTSFRLVMAASVQELIEEGGVVRGVRFRGRDGWHELRATLTVGADGRFSAIRRLAGLPPAIKTSPPMDVLWFRVSRKPGDPDGVMADIRAGHVLVMLDRGEQWQVGYVIPKGQYKTIHAAGLDVFRRSVAELSPLLAERAGTITEWKQVSLLSVESDRMPRWYRHGLLVIGDAAHVMSPVGGNGINYAVQDAVAAANILAGPLKVGKVTTQHLAAVQRRRDWPTRMTQALVTQLQNQVLSTALGSEGASGPPPVLLRIMARFPLLVDLVARWMAFGIWPVHVRR